MQPVWHAIYKHIFSPKPHKIAAFWHSFLKIFCGGMPPDPPRFSMLHMLGRRVLQQAIILAK